MAVDATEWKKTRRPETATLDKPALLDPCWLKKLDMTTLTGENIIDLENLILSKNLQVKPGGGEAGADDARLRKVGHVLKATYRVRTRTAEDAAKKESIKNKEDVRSAVPSPCHTCDRTAMRERFHTHPMNKKTKTHVDDSKIGKGSNVKPVSIKFKSEKPKESSECSRLDPPNSAKSQVKSPVAHLRKTESAKRPEKDPDSPASGPIVRCSRSKRFSDEEMEVHHRDQVIFVKCTGCSRSFHPNRISVHESACLEARRNVPKMENKLSTLTYCYVCGKVFEKKSLLLPNHIEECLAKWHKENQALPESLRKPEPIKTDMILEEMAGLDESFWQQHLTKLIPCLKCGRKFNPDRVKVHEKSCKGLSK